jgi:hypothetical protein
MYNIQSLRFLELGADNAESNDVWNVTPYILVDLVNNVLKESTVSLPREDNAR